MQSTVPVHKTAPLGAASPADTALTKFVHGIDVSMAPDGKRGRLTLNDYYNTVSVEFLTMNLTQQIVSQLTTTG